MICKHFGICGGCLHQHLDGDSYRLLKEDFVLEPLRFTGVPYEKILPFQQVPPHSRRRANFKVIKQKGRVTLGYYQRKSHDLVMVEECLLVVEELEKNLPALRDLCGLLMQNSENAEMHVLASLTGLDVSLTLKKTPKFSLAQLESLIEHARKSEWARLSINDELIVQFQQPMVRFSGMDIPADAKSFLQVSEASDELLITAVESAFSGEMKSAADLFAGRGTFSHLLACRTKVDAYEMDDLALRVLQQTAQSNKKPITAYKRDLFQDPVDAKTLSRYDFLVMDPPRAGAKAQSEEIAKSTLSKFVYVSCNPKTFARDAKIICDGGFLLESITPIDQFLWSDHMEVVGVFSKKSK